MMNDGLKFGPHTEVFAVDSSQFMALILPLEVVDYIFNSTDRQEIYENLAEAYNSRFDDDIEI